MFAGLTELFSQYLCIGHPLISYNCTHRPSVITVACGKASESFVLKNAQGVVTHTLHVEAFATGIKNFDRETCA